MDIIYAEEFFMHSCTFLQRNAITGRSGSGKVRDFRLKNEEKREN